MTALGEGSLVAPASVGEVGPVLLAGALTLFTTVVGWIAYRLKPPEKPPGDAGKDVAVVSATFADKAQIQMLAASLEAVNVELVTLNMHLKNEAQRRHDEALIRQALKERGIVE